MDHSLLRLTSLCLLLLAIAVCVPPLGCGGGGGGGDDEEEEETGNLSPTLSITAPDDGSSYAVGDEIRFVGAGTDPEDGDLDPNVLTWTSDIDGPFGVGNLVNYAGLGHGLHTITLRGIDTTGEPGLATIEVTVLAEIRPPTPGDLVITEAMVDPSAVLDADGEWFEIYNTTEYRIDLKLLQFKDDVSDTFTIVGAPNSYILDPFSYFVLGANRNVLVNGGAPVDYAYANLMTLDEGPDEIVIWTGVVEIDRVNFDDTWPWSEGRAMSLSETTLTAAENDNVENWCDVLAIYGLGDRGTPGDPNPICP